MADEKDEIKQYFTDFVSLANLVADTLAGINSHLTGQGGPPMGAGITKKLEKYILQNPHDSTLYRQIEAFATNSKNLSDEVINNAKNYHERWDIESRRNHDVEERSEKARWVQFKHKIFRWLLGLVFAIGLYSGAVAMSESDYELLNWVKIPGRDIIQQLIKGASGGS